MMHSYCRSAIVMSGSPAVASIGDSVSRRICISTDCYVIHAVPTSFGIVPGVQMSSTITMAPAELHDIKRVHLDVTNSDSLRDIVMRRILVASDVHSPLLPEVDGAVVDLPVDVVVFVNGLCFSSDDSESCGCMRIANSFVQALAEAKYKGKVWCNALPA